MSASVSGFDVGNDTSCVAIARKRGIDVLLNKESKRETPALVNFGEKMRFIGTDGAAKQGLSPQNTVNQLKRLLGKRFSDPAVQADIARLPFSVTAAPDGGCLINVQFLNESHSFTPEQIMAMVLGDLKKIVEVETGVPPIDCVVTVPAYYTESQRYAMLNSITIAGLNCLRLMNETTATALAYGIFKTDLPEEPVHVAFVDMGHSSTQVSVVSLKKGGLQVRCHAWDANLGGRDLDELLFAHFVAEFKAKFKIDIASNKKASFKLRVAVEKLKKILSANAEAPIGVECIMEDTDVRGSMNRDTLEELAAPLAARLKSVLEEGLAQSGLTVADISSVEVIGGSMRVPLFARAVEGVFGQAPSRTMNAKECVARGAALQAAMLSPVFKVRDFDVVDSCPYPVDFAWEKDGKPTGQRLFERNSAFPGAKMLTLLRTAPFALTAVNGATGDKLGEYQVGPFVVPPGAEVAKLKVKVRMNLHGLVGVESVQSIEEESVPVTDGGVAPGTSSAGGDVPMQDASAPSQDPGAPAPMETDAAGPPKPGAEPNKKRVKKIDVAYEPSGVAGYTQQQLDGYFEQEGQMAAGDRLQEETADRKNAVEAYVLKMRHGLYGALEQYIKPADKEALLAKLQAAEDWLYDEGEDVTKSVYVAKLEEMQQLCAPVEQRAAEDEARPSAATALRSTAEGYLTWANNTDARYAHITPEERAPVAQEAQAALKWLADKQALQSQLSKTDPPVLLAADCQKKVDTLERLARPIVNKPAPAKPSPAKPAADAAPEPAPAAAADGPAPMESEGGSEGAPTA